MSDQTSGPAFDNLKPGDFVKVRVGNEGLWFEMLDRVENNALVARLANNPVTGIVFDGRCTIDRDWIVDTASKRVRPDLKVVS